VAAFVLHTAVLARGNAMSPHELEKAAEVARAAFERSVAAGDRHTAAGDAYNVGKALANAGDWAASVRMFRQAVELDPTCGAHAYFLFDLAVSPVRVARV
jgi:Flp pilus assembly protein TadD